MKATPTVLCLHAITRSGRDFRPFAQALSRDFDVLTPDLLGHGQTPRSASYLLADYRDALLVELPRGCDIILWGHSLGGLVALALADKYGDRVVGVVLEDVPLFEVEWPRFRDGPFYSGFKALHEQLSAKTPNRSALAAEVAAWPSGDGQTHLGARFGDAIVDQRTEDLLNLDVAALVPPLTGQLAGDIDIRKILAHLQCPVWLLAGNRTLGSALTEHDLNTFETLCADGHLHNFTSLGHDIRLFEQTACTDLVIQIARG